MASGLGAYGRPGHDLHAQTHEELGVGGDAHHRRCVSIHKVALIAGESAFRQDEYEEALQRFDDYGVKLSVV